MRIEFASEVEPDSGRRLIADHSGTTADTAFRNGA
jgi:hypothetical protein